MATWKEIAKNNLEGAKVLAAKGHYRSCISRSYYAAFSASSATLEHLAPFAMNRETPPHHRVPVLLERHFGSGGVHQLRKVKSALRRLYNNRIGADYKSGVTVAEREARAAQIDAHAICRFLGISNADNH